MDIVDNCPSTANPGQEDVDLDDAGNVCDTEGPSPNSNGLGNGDDCSDGVDNDGDGLIDEADPACDSDGDGVSDIADNCPSTANPGQTDSDGEGLGDVCDPCPADTDCDADGHNDYDETLIGTDPADACGAACWPPDFNDDQLINLIDLNKLLPPPLGSWGASPGNPDPNGDGTDDWSPRRDIVPDGVINLPDLNKTLPAPLGAWGETCTP